MTYTEAAVEVLRRAGKPLHFKDIATEAVNANLLSHVGQTPEETMGMRLLSMSRREADRKIVTLDTGIFALAEWGLPVPAVVEPPAIIPVVDETAPQYRPRERHPPMQAEVVVGGRRDDRRRREEDDGQRKKRYGPPADAAYQWLKEKGQAVPLAEVAAALRETDRIAEALERDLQSFDRALKEENRRRQDGRRPPLFEFAEGGVVRALDLPKELPRTEKQRPERPERPRRDETPRPMATGIDEQKRNVMRSVRRRLGSLDNAALERVCVALLEAQGYRELNMARRSAKEGPLYLTRRKWGAGEMRYVIRILRPGRDLGRPEVQDVRRDLSHYSGQVGIVFGTGECSRESKSEANIPGQAPVMLYGGEALAEALVEASLGATKRLVEWFDYDDEFFTSIGAGEVLPDVEGVAPPPITDASSAEASPSALSPAAAPESEERSGRRGRDRRPPRRREGRPEGTAPTSTPVEGAAAESAPVTDGAPPESVPTSEAAPAPEASPTPEAAPVEAAPPPPPAPAPVSDSPPPVSDDGNSSAS
jgi:restriction endonuclease Mrr